MTRRLAFLHTSPVHIETFAQLAAKVCPEISLAHVVDEELLQDARRLGITPDLEGRIEEILDDMVRDDAAVVVCTCSAAGAGGGGRRLRR